MTTFRIVPTVGKNGVLYRIQRKGLFSWRFLRESGYGMLDAMSWCSTLFMGESISHYPSPEVALKRIRYHYGASAKVVDWVG